MNNNIDKSNDDIVENYIFNTILTSSSINKEILKIHDSIINESISIKDKKILLFLTLWKNINDTEEEITKLRNNIRNNKIQWAWLYQLIFSFIEQIFDINNDSAMYIFYNNKNQEALYEIKKLLIEVINIYWELLIKTLKEQKSFSELIKKDYLDDNELDIVISNLKNINEKILKDSRNIIEEYNKNINSILEKEIYKINKIKNISAFPKK